MKKSFGVWETTNQGYRTETEFSELKEIEKDYERNMESIREEVYQQNSN